MPLFVMIIIASDMTRPSVQANRFGLADTHNGVCRRVIQCAIIPIGLYLIPAVTRIRNSKKNSVVTIWIGA